MPHKSDWTGGLTKDELGQSAEVTTALAGAEQQQGGETTQAGDGATPARVVEFDQPDDDPRAMSLAALKRQTHTD